MHTPMDILFVATELAPYAKVGGLADVVAALSKTLRQHGHQVTLALPRFPQFERSGLLVARRLTPLSFELGGRRHTATVYDGRLPSGADITLLDLPGFFDRLGIYGEDGHDYQDNPVRFAAFCRAVVELAQQRMAAGRPFDIVHVHDWPTALVPLHARFIAIPELAARTRFVCTIHNLAYQGSADATLLSALGIPDRLFNPDGVEFYGKVNVLKAALVYSDAITTVSRTYAREVQTAQQGRGLEGVLASRASKLVGIVNGIDYSLWNPASDPALVARFDAENLTNKMRCKTALLTEAELEMVPERPVLAFMSRLSEQKGIDILIDALPALMRSDLALVVHGDGEASAVQGLAAAEAKWPGRLKFVRSAPDAFAHRLLAGADIVLVPSRFEPCGVVQLQAQRYGTVPVARAAGGLVDTIVDCDASLETGTGFLFEDATMQGLIGGVQRALAAYASPRWQLLRQRIMRLDVGWDRAAHRYAQLYRSLLPA